GVVRAVAGQEDGADRRGVRGGRLPDVAGRTHHSVPLRVGREDEHPAGLAAGRRGVWATGVPGGGPVPVSGGETWGIPAARERQRYCTHTRVLRRKGTVGWSVEITANAVPDLGRTRANRRRRHPALTVITPGRRKGRRGSKHVGGRKRSGCTGR